MLADKARRSHNRHMTIVAEQDESDELGCPATSAGFTLDLDDYELDMAREKHAGRQRRFGFALLVLMLPGLLAVPSWLGSKKKRARTCDVQQERCAAQCKAADVARRTFVSIAFTDCFEQCTPSYCQ